MKTAMARLAVMMKPAPQPGLLPEPGRGGAGGARCWATTA